ncbi:hypothetical protein NQ152_08460 [Microbacterium sp. zg.B48]|uniref:hypothetical protein n=1 Tax=Microbacterium sp. zg.B48 TaxID=2969408 RepID=UPI00214B22FB|nr:hypothetical protein [Microbacterium sp. zg.B48]MCR2763541.1 hypothetical protein [Microbacterium sp. zg.B48]
MKKRMIIVGAVVAAAGMVTVGGLAASGGVFTNPEAGPLPEGVGVVTQQVYDDAYATFEACMNEGGAELFGERDEAGVHHASYLAQFQPVYDKCYVDFAPVDFRWQIAHSYDSETFVRYRECLTEVGVEPGKDAETVLAQVEKSGIDVRNCFEGATNG